MRTQLALAGALSVSLLAGSVVPAFTDVGASGTRLSVAGGVPRFYMTYGHAEDVELYAPITQELRRLEITFEHRGDDMWVLHRGARVAEWPIVRSREDVPDTGENPCVLVMGGNIYVPIRQLEELLPVSVKWDKKANLLSLVPGPAKPKTQTARAGQAPKPASPAGPGMEDGDGITLTGIEVKENNGKVEINVRSTHPVRPNRLYLKNPARLVLDFPGARWVDGIQAPEGTGQVKTFRTGHPTPDTARLVLDLSSAALKLTSLRVTDGEVLAQVGLGVDAPVPNVTAAAEARMIKAIVRRNPKRIAGLGSRQGGLDGSRVTSRLPGAPGDLLRLGDSLAGRVICVDPGHGGHSPGAKGLENLEKDLCLKMSLEFKRALEARGATVIMTRSGDEFVSLEGRCQIANSRGAEIFISIHCNSMPRRNTASGSETYYHTPQSVGLAQALHGRLVGAVSGRDGGIRNRRFYVVRNTTMPSVLLEIAYINNTLDEQLLARPDFHGSLAESLAEGVVDYFNVGG